MNKEVMVETSARHVHVTREDLDTLFGKGHELTVKKTLSQPGQFVSMEKVKVVGSRNELAASILGPVRSYTQVELSLTDARSIGVTAPIRESGDIAGTGKCKIVGPEGEIDIEEGVIAAKRHVHATVADAAELGLKDKQIVKVEIGSGERKVIFGDVIVRVSDNYKFAMHIDTDESNAACAGPGTMGKIID